MKHLSAIMDLTGKTAIVTGGASGIGLGIVYRLAEAGANVMIAGIDKKENTQTLKNLHAKGWHVQAVQADVSDERDVKRMIRATIKEFGAINILVNNAGIFPSMPISAMKATDFAKVIAVNLGGVFLCTKYVSEQMIQQGHGGKIINVTSIDALHPSSIGLAHYDASKHGAWGFTKNAALELAMHKIWVNAIAPGGINTPGVMRQRQAQTPAEVANMKKVMEGFLHKIPMHRMGEPDDIGKVALFLASDLSSYLTGTQIVVDGGYLLS